MRPGRAFIRRCCAAPQATTRRAVRMLLCALACGAALPLQAEDAPRPTTLPGHLTAFGAERAGTADGGIPAWPASAESCAALPAEAPLQVVSAANRADWDALLSEGQRALLTAYPETFQLPVYATRRCYAQPAAFDAGTLANLGRTQLRDGELLRAGGGLPFAIPATGDEVIWNHRLRYRAARRERELRQWAVSASGEAVEARVLERERYRYGALAPQSRLGRQALVQLAQWLLAPRALAGNGVRFEDTARPGDFAARSYQFAIGDAKVRHVPNLGYDSAAIGSEDLLSSDQIDSYFGPMDRYKWELLGKRELLVPANSSALRELHRDAARSPLMGRHLDPQLSRYERRRVWVVEARLAPNRVHRYAKRRFFVDEDGWQIRLVEIYGIDDRLWRVQETHTVSAPAPGGEITVAEAVYDLVDSRYLVRALNREEPGVEESFTPASLARQGRRFAAAARS